TSTPDERDTETRNRRRSGPSAPSAVLVSDRPSGDQLALCVVFRCFAAGAVQLFTRAAVTFRSFSTSSAVLPDAIASLICLHEGPVAFFFAAHTGDPTTAIIT